eukprot:4684101-Lingulodinium_polyedra.AAC.1
MGWDAPSEWAWRIGMRSRHRCKSLCDAVSNPSLNACAMPWHGLAQNALADDFMLACIKSCLGLHDIV